ncbi:MAG: polysialyltransferase family glycosyltransferase, partial [Synechococcales bacterium]|nr:polysialyltransferase family glycosyltransferase [Synechococcales bacterium]
MTMLEMTTLAPQNMPSRQVLLCVQGTAQLLAAIAAAKYREQLFPNQVTEYILVVYDLLAQQQDSAFTQAIFELAEPWQFSHKVFLDASTLNQLVKSFQPRSKKIQKLQDLIGVRRVDEIYLCRDYIGYGSNFLLNAYAQATKITYGDGYGFVCSRTFFEKYTYISQTGWQRLVDSWQQRFKYSLKRFMGWELPTLQFDLALLTIPVDYCGEYLRQVDHQFVPLQVLEKILQVTREAIAPRYTQYLQTVLEGSAIDLLLLTSTFTEANYACLENEVALYINRIQSLVTPGSTLAIKPHPRTSA